MIAPLVAAPALYFAAFVLAAELLLLMSLLGIGMIRAPCAPGTGHRASSTFSPLAMLLVVGGFVAGGIDAGRGSTLLLPVAAGFSWLGWAMWNVPAPIFTVTIGAGTSSPPERPASSRRNECTAPLSRRRCA